MGTARYWIELRYGWGAGIVLARSVNRQLLKMVKSELLAEARKRAHEGEEVDEILGMMHRADLRRLDQLLSRLIPD